MCVRLLLLGLLLAVTSACGGGRYGGGLVIDEHGAAMGTSTKAARDAERAISNSIAEACGAAWQVQTTIAEEPRWDDVAEDWRWPAASVTLTLTGSGQAPLANAEIRDAIERWFARRMVARTAKPTVVIRRVEQAESPTVPTSGPIGGWRYTIKKGDTLALLSTAFYNTPEHWRRILDANPGLQADRLVEGAVISIPSPP